MIKFLANYLAYFLLLGWLVYSLYNLRKYKTSNPYLLQLIPSIFTTIGVFGTFLGIAYGLYHFNESDIIGSIPELLKGMRSAFLTSILGIFLSVVFSNILAWLSQKMDEELPSQSMSELQALQKLIEIIEQSKEEDITLKKSLLQGIQDNSQAVNDLNKQNKLNAESYKSELQKQFELANDLKTTHQNETIKIATQNKEQIIQAMTENNRQIQNKFEEFSVLLAKNNTEALQKLIEIIEESKEEDITLKKSLLQGVQDNNQAVNDLNKQNKLNAEGYKSELQKQFELANDLKTTHQNETIKIVAQNKEQVIQTMTENNRQIQNKFEEFSVLLAKNNTEALVTAMEKVITDFNEKMNSLIQKLVKENFQELNNSVKRLNNWQIENKAQVETLIHQFKAVSTNLVTTSASIKAITINTEKLTNEEGHLVQLIEELQEVMIEDTKFKALIDKVSTIIDALKSTTNEFEETTNALNKWVRDERNIKQSVQALLAKMQELDKIKSYDSQFWRDTKLKMEEGVSIIQRANIKLSTDVKTIDAQFYKRLNTTLQSLDQLIQQFILNSNQ